MTDRPSVNMITLYCNHYQHCCTLDYSTNRCAGWSAHQRMCHSNLPKATRMFDLNFAVTEWQIEVDCHDWGLKQQLGCDVEALEGCEGISLAVAVVEEGQSRIFLSLLSSDQWWCWRRCSSKRVQQRREQVGCLHLLLIGCAVVVGRWHVACGWHDWFWFLMAAMVVVVGQSSVAWFILVD